MNWKTRKIFLIVAILLIPLVLGINSFKRACADHDKACLQTALTSHKVRQANFWKTELSKPFLQRMAPAPEALVEYVTLDNQFNGYPQRPRSVALDAGFMQDAQAALDEIPTDIRRLFDDRLVGIFFLEELGGSGYTDFVYNSKGERMGAYIVLDASVLKELNANAWATWKESSPFKVATGFSLNAQIETAANDNRKNAIQYILLHELGHVLSVGGNMHPPWDQKIQSVPVGAYPFFDLSWMVDPKENRYTSHFDSSFLQRKNVSYYFGAKLMGSDMVATYDNLEMTNFPSLYASTSPADDFAESFASYVHVVRMGRPWHIAIGHDGTVVKTFKACWEEERCAVKRAILERQLK